jgi:hypothetical protein
MANSDYVGRYGAALRKLQALEMGGLQGVPGTMSQDGAQPGGAFGAVSPDVAQMGQPVANQPAPAGGAFDKAEPKPMFDKPMTAADVYAQMPPEQKTALLQQVEKNGMSVDKRFDQLVAKGEIPQVPKKKKMTKEEKLGYLAEVALRTISNLGREGTTSSADWADATLATNERRSALEMAEQERARQQAEVIRREGREDAKETRTVGREEAREQREVARGGATIETNQAFTAEQNRLDRESREREARLRAEQDKRQNQKVLVDDGGNMYTLGEDGRAAPIKTTKEVVEETKGKRGVTVRIRKQVEQQLKALPKADVAGIDKDTIMREIGNRIKALKEDGKLGRELKRKGVSDVEGEIARRATEQVMQEYGVVSGKQPDGATTPSGGLSAEDQSLLDKWGQAQ